MAALSDQTMSLLLLLLAAAVAVSYAWPWLLLLRINLKRRRKTTTTNKKSEEADAKLRLELPPGRMGLPLVGETLDYLRMSRHNRAWEFVADRVRANASETFKTNVFGSRTVVVTSPAGAKMAFANTRVSWPQSILNVMGSEAQTGHKGQRIDIRNAFHAFLNPEALKRYIHPVSNIVHAFLLPFSSVSHTFQYSPLDLALYSFMHKLTFSILCHILVGIHDPSDQHSLFLHFDTFMRGVIQLPINFPGTLYSKSVAASRAIKDKLQNLIHRKRAECATTGHDRPVDVLSRLVTYEDEDGKVLSDQEIAENLLALLFAGKDTSSNAATMACRFLALHPTIMDDVYKENKVIADALPPSPAPAVLRWEDLQKMKLTWRVVQETMRLQPPALGVFRVATEDMSFDGYRIPKSWQIFWPTNWTSRNPKYFPEPERFDPSRFEGAGPTPFTYAPFGGGASMCPGYQFARMEILIIIHHLITRFSWTLKDPNEAISVDPFPIPANGLHILLQPRNNTS